MSKVAPRDGWYRNRARYTGVSAADTLYCLPYRFSRWAILLLRTERQASIPRPAAARVNPGGFKARVGLRISDQTDIRILFLICSAS
jgi:hypothetical protein